MNDQLSLFDQRPPPQKSEVPLEQQLEPIPINKDIRGNTLASLVPQGALLELNRGYATRASYAGRILRLFQERTLRGQPFKRDDVAVELSIAAARFAGTVGVMRRAELIGHKSAPTALGNLVLTYSPYLDDTGLLWLLHFLLASDACLVLWSHLFNQALLSANGIIIAGVASQHASLAGRWSQRTLEEKAPKEIGGIIRTYSDEMFAPLGLLVRQDVGTYDVHSNTGMIPPLIWLACVLVYRDRYYPGAPSLEVPLIVDANFSPGRLLRQKEAAVRKALDELHNAGLLTVETRSGLDQVRFKRDITWLSATARYFRDKRLP